MENGGVENAHGDGNGNGQAASYTYWVRETMADAAPLPVPKKLTAQDILSTQSQPTSLGSVWNKAGTWEEKNLNNWATQRLKVLSCGGVLSPAIQGEPKGLHRELLKSVGSLDLSCGKAEISDVTKCVGDAFLVTVRNKKRVGYTYELTLKIKGEWHLREEKKTVNGHIDIPEFSFGELDDLQMAVQLSEEKDYVQQDKQQIIQDLKKRFLQPVREKLLQFEQELKDR
ncbi:Activator of 90 kDa heat shock ATPase [Gossypium arboreum]|uniref:Activator of 90 kDa heat shock ATPase n=1 Tax=Gossypium arboreum TaxID=29729 RepID=A0A0B0NHK7_GOSAR|nr:Activator of 90 kDa heat shock ATPase [Gossypium arboreum]